MMPTLAGLVSGVIVGWIAVVMRDGPANVAALAGALSPVLWLVLPAAAAMGSWIIQGEDRPRVVRLLVAAGAGALGAAFGAALYLVAVMQIAGVFGGEAASEVMLALRPEVGWLVPLVACGLAAVAALVAAWSEHSDA